MRRYTMRRVVIAGIMVCFTMPLHAITVETIVAELNARHQMIMQRAGTIKISQSITSLSNGDEINSNQIVLKKDNRYRIETISDMHIDKERTKNIILFDGDNVWFISPFAGKALMPKDESMIQGIFEDYSKLIPTSSILMEDEKVNDEECYVITVPGKSGNVLRKIWISKERFVPLKAIGKVLGYAFLLNFTDYKKVYGIWGIPYRTEAFSILTDVTKKSKPMLHRKPSSIIVVDDVELGLELEESIFDIKSQ
jgi:outer membrane lipoprotein-sorting protein